MAANGEITHPSIVDGWFRETSAEQWPGQAMSLQVKKVLHHEKSLFQDVLVFESTDYGNVLVLDGVIQCTERDEFSYQEMITHLPMASHPAPKKVLVIGGGDGGVLREVLKHDMVEEVTLCDIDEAVPRVSKKYLPHMAVGLTHPKVTVHIGDGFKFLADKVGQYDVIITDSSDPVGPAESLFKKPYFELLRDALRDGGHISTQAENVWIHLPLIRELRQTTLSLFPTAEYAFTTIPTYPCGSIGFVVCSKDGSRNVKAPLRKVAGCKYYNENVHKAAFVLPEFARQVIQDGTAAPKKVVASGAEGKPPKKVLLLGSGYVARPAAEYVLRRPENYLTVASSRLANAQALASTLPRATAVALNVSSTSELDALVSEHDLVISLIPYTYHAAVVKSAIKHKKHVVTTSYVSDALRELDAPAKEAGITVMNEIGLDPGIDHLYAVKTISEVHAKGGKINGFLSYCGGLPAPEAADNPLGYKFSWSSRGVLLALRNSARFIQDGKERSVSGPELMGTAKPYYISPAFAFVAYPNRDSTPFKEFYKIPEAQTVVRGTLRYQGFPEFIAALVELGFLDDTEKEWLKVGEKVPWADVLAKAIGAKNTSEATLVSAVSSRCFSSPGEGEVILQGLRWIGLFSTTAYATVRGVSSTSSNGNLLDTLCATLEEKCQYDEGERDMVMLQHRFEVETKEGNKEVITSTLLDYGDPHGYSSMARLVGIPCGVAVQHVLDGVISQKGVLAPYTPELVEPLREGVEKEGIRMVEKRIS